MARFLREDWAVRWVLIWCHLRRVHMIVFIVNLDRTTNKTMQRKEWVPVDCIIEQLSGKLDSKPDYITLSGSGEPTLYSRLEKLISSIKEITDIPVAVHNFHTSLLNNCFRG